MSFLSFYTLEANTHVGDGIYCFLAPDPIQSTLPKPPRSFSNTQQSSFCFIGEFRDVEFVLPKDVYMAVATEAEVGAAPVDLDLADQHPAAVPDVDPVAAAAVHVAMDVALDPIGGPGIDVGEDTPVCQEGLVLFPEHAVGIYCRCTAIVLRTIAMYEICIGDVDGVFVRRKADSIRPSEAVRHHSNVAGSWVKAVNELRQLRFWSKALLVSIDWVGEPDSAVGMHDHIVWRIEWTRMVVVEQRGGFVWSLSLHIDKPGRLPQRTLGAEYQTVAVVCPAIGHVIAFRTTDFVPGKVGWREKFDFCNHDRLVMGADSIRRRVADLVGGHEEGIGRRVEYAGLMEVRRPWVVY